VEEVHRGNWKKFTALGGRSGPRYALIAAFLVAISTYNINYAQEAKMYSMLWCLATAGVPVFFKMVKFSQILRPDFIYRIY
jgi:uncharacterized membrane protein